MFLFHRYCEGGNLYNMVKTLKRLTESQAAKVLMQVLSAVEYCHTKGIVHRDLKPENILLEKKDINSTIKIIDFGRSKILKPNEKLFEMAGSVIKIISIYNNLFSLIIWLLK